MKNNLFAMAIVAVSLAGCMVTPYPAITDFTDDKVEVRVRYTIPMLDPALTASRPHAEEHCRSVGKESYTFMSSRDRRVDEYSGEWIFLFRCDGPDRVVIE